MYRKLINCPMLPILVSLLFLTPAYPKARPSGRFSSAAEAREKEKACPTEASGRRAVTLDTDPNLVGWWKFDDISGINAVDSSKHPDVLRGKGTLKGGLSFDKNSVSGKIGKALSLDGLDDYIQITKYKGVTGTRPRTVMAWIKTKTPKGEIISWGLNDYGQMWIFGFIRGRVGVTPNGGYLYINAATDDDAWHHVAAVVHSRKGRCADAGLPNLYDDVTLYKDGTLAEIHDIGLLDLWPIETGSDLDVTIGREFKGIIDDVRIYDRALSEDEIKAFFELKSNQPACPEYPMKEKAPPKDGTAGRPLPKTR